MGANPTDDDIIERSRDCDVIVTKEIQIAESVIMRLPSTVKLICEAGTGFNNVSLDACRSRGILVANVPSYSEGAVASLVITFLLNFSCGMQAQQRRLLQGDKTRFINGLPSEEHFELEGKTLGLIGGRGNIGTRVAQTARTLGMNILISSRAIPDPASQLPGGGVSYTDSVEFLLQNSDFVSIHCPLNSETKDLINARTLRLMKPTAYLINTARGPIIDESALIQALQEGVIAGAALDVQSVEPPVPDSPLYSLPNVILTPHVGWKRFETRRRLVEAVRDNISAFVAGSPINIVT